MGPSVMKTSRRWLGVHIAAIGALLSIVFGAFAIAFSGDTNGFAYTLFFWLGALCAPLVFVGMVVQLVGYRSKEDGT